MKGLWDQRLWPNAVLPWTSVWSSQFLLSLFLFLPLFPIFSCLFLLTSHYPLLFLVALPPFLYPLSRPFISLPYIRIILGSYKKSKLTGALGNASQKTPLHLQAHCLYGGASEPDIVAQCSFASDFSLQSNQFSLGLFLFLTFPPCLISSSLPSIITFFFC